SRAGSTSTVTAARRSRSRAAPRSWWTTVSRRARRCARRFRPCACETRRASSSRCRSRRARRAPSWTRKPTRSCAHRRRHRSAASAPGTTTSRKRRTKKFARCWRSRSSRRRSRRARCRDEASRSLEPCEGVDAWRPSPSRPSTRWSSSRTAARGSSRSTARRDRALRSVRDPHGDQRAAAGRDYEHAASVSGSSGVRRRRAQAGGEPGHRLLQRPEARDLADDDAAGVRSERELRCDCAVVGDQPRRRDAHPLLDRRSRVVGVRGAPHHREAPVEQRCGLVLREHAAAGRTANRHSRSGISDRKRADGRAERSDGQGTKSIGSGGLMTNKRIALTAAAIVAGVMMAAAPALAELHPGATAPEFTAQAALGGDVETFDLKQALAKGPVVLYFFPKSFTSGCTEEAHAFSDHIADFKKL